MAIAYLQVVQISIEVTQDGYRFTEDAYGVRNISKVTATYIAGMASLVSDVRKKSDDALKRAAEVQDGLAEVMIRLLIDLLNCLL